MTGIRNTIMALEAERGGSLFLLIQAEPAKSHFQANPWFDFSQYPVHALRAGLIPVLGPTEAPVRTMLVAALLSFSIPALAQAPGIPMQEAIQRAEQYIQNRQIQNDHRYLDSAKWHFNHEERQKSCWSLMWDVPASPPITDSHLLVNVCVNGRIWHHDDWG